MSDDQGIVEMTREICQQLGITRFKPKEVVWVERNPFASIGLRDPMPSDWALFFHGQIYLASRLRERLGLEDWRPIMTSSLIYAFGHRVPGSDSRVRLSTTMRFILFTIAYLGGFAVVGSLAWGFSATSDAFLYYAWIPLVPLAAVYARRSGRTLAGRMLRADLRAGELVGRERVLSVLEKIDAMRLDDVERNKVEWAKRSRHTHGPSIAERIANLQSGGASTRAP